jgi:hypothetical protein
MGSNGNHVKQLLASARIHHRPELLQEVVEELRAAEDKSGTMLTELRVLCSEVAVELQQWQVASLLLRGIGAAHETRLLRIRQTFCDVLVSLHDVDTQQSFSEEEKVKEKLVGAATVVQTLADGVELWPDSADAVLIGIRTLWTIISPLLDAGYHADVCDAVVFLASLHQQLHIGGGYTLVQWMARSARCLYAADRVTEAFAHFTTAMDTAALLANHRLYVQLLRMSAGAVNAKERATASTKGKTELLGSYRSRPIVYAVLLTQLVLAGQVDVDTCRDELHSTYETVHSGNSEVAVPTETTATSAGKGKKKVAAAKQQQQQAPSTRVMDAFVITDADVVEEVKSDLLLCIALHDTLTPQQLEELERKRNSTNRRVRSFTAFALLVQEARCCGLAQLNTCADASVLTAAHRSDLKTVTQQLLSVLKGTNAIHDESERRYTLHVGVSLLWNYLLPFLQPALTGDVQAALDAILEVSQAAVPQLRQLFLQVGLQQCHIAYSEDHRSTLHHLLAVLRQEYARCAVRSGIAHIEFPLQWMEYQVAILEEPETSLASEQDRCLFALEQARTVSVPLKRVPLLKAAFQHLPPLLYEEPRPEPVLSDATLNPAKRSPQQQQQQSSPASTSVCAPVQRRSTVQLYKELLDLCMEDVSPSLYAVASAVAEALRSLPCPPSAPTVDDLEEIQAAASLHSAILQWKQLEEEASTNATTNALSATSAGAPTAGAGAGRGGGRQQGGGGEAQLASLLKETAARGASLENRRAGSGAWIVSNACVAFLKLKQSAYDAGDYSGHMAELLELQSTYTTLFTKARVQDVSLLYDLTVAAVVGLLADFVAAKAASSTAASPNAPLGVVTASASVLQDAMYANLMRRIQSCTAVESSNAQLRKAEVLSREALQLISAPRLKWFVAMLYPTLLRLLNEKPVVFVHPQEQLLVDLGALAGPSLTLTERQALLEQEMLALLRKDPSVRLCAWVATIAAEMHLEDLVLECCQLADTLYDGGRLGWDSLYEVQRTTTLSGAAAAAAAPHSNSILSSGSGLRGSVIGGPGATMNGTTSNTNKKISTSAVLVQREGATPVKPDREDWGAYAQLLSMKTLVCANHLQGLRGDVRRLALQQLFTNCVNSVIAAMHGPLAFKVAHFTRAFSSYYAILRDNNNNNTLPLSEAAFLLPSMRMLLSKAILSQIPKREWNATFTEVVYELSTILMYVSYSSGRDNDVQQLGTHLRLLRELLPTRLQRSLKVRETTETCYRNPNVESFLSLSRNMEAELQTHGWLIVAQRTADDGSAAEAFALALSGTQDNTFARAQCLFEYAYASLLQSSQPLSHAVDQLREALRTLEGLPDNVSLFHEAAAAAGGQCSLNATLVDKSLTASFLKTRRKQSSDGRTATSNTNTNAAAGEKKRAVAAGCVPVRKAASTAAKGHTITFQHVLLGLRIVALLFRVATPAAATSLPLATGAGAAAVKASKNAAMASRRDCANVMLDYILCLWELCGEVLREKGSGEGNSEGSGSNEGFVLPESAAEFYGFGEAAGVAQRVRRLLRDEELRLNTEGLWLAMLELGEYLLQSGDEPHTFMVYSWIRFAAVMALGEPSSSAQCALVQRVCNLQMCLTATASGLSDAPYVAALRRLDEIHLPLDTGALLPSSSSTQHSTVRGETAASTWLIDFLLAECETRASLGQIEEAAAVASKYLTGDASRHSSRSNAGGNDAPTTTINSSAALGGLRILALREVVCARYDAALGLVNEAFQGMQSHHSAFEASSRFSAKMWIRLCYVKLQALLAKKAASQALQFIVAVREQLSKWRATVLAMPKSSHTLSILCLRGELFDAIQYWGLQVTSAASALHPHFTALQLFPEAAGPLRSLSVKMFQEVLVLIEPENSLQCRMNALAVRFYLRDRVTPSWVAQHANSPKEHLCPRLKTLLTEVNTLQQALESLNYAAVGAVAMENDADARPDRSKAKGSSSAGALPGSAKTASVRSLWQAFLLYWIAVDRLEANHIAECLLGSFRRLSMADLQLPTSDAPAHLEREVLKFIRGAADGDASTSDNSTAAVTPLSTPRGKVGTRWRHMPKAAITEIEQALKHYGLPIQEVQAIMDLSSVQPLIRQSVELARPWSFSRLAKLFLITFAETEVQRHTENQIAASDDMVGEKLDRQREVLLTAAWNRVPLVPPKTDKAAGRSRKSLCSPKQRSSNESSIVFSAPALSTEERDLLQHIQGGAEEAVQHLQLDLAEQLYCHLSSLAVLLGCPRLAAAAAEQQQACQLISFLSVKVEHEMADSAEGRLWRQFCLVHPLIRHATASKALLDEVLAMSPMGKYIRSCSTLCVKDKNDEEVTLPPSSSHARDVVLPEASPFAIDTPVLTITLSNNHVGYCLVLLRHPDGVVEGRRKSLLEAEWRSLVEQCEGMQNNKADALGRVKGGRLNSAAQRITSEDTASLLEPLKPITSRLLLDFQSSLQAFGAKSPLYLCVGPHLQAFAWEQTSALAACSAVVRELGAAMVVSKYNEPNRALRRPSTHNSKSTSPSATKGVPPGACVCIIDAFGDHTDSVDSVLNADSAKVKNTQPLLVTCSSPGSPPDPAYIAWMLSAYAPSSMVVDMCGSFTDALPLAHLAALRLSHVNVAIMADGAVNADSRQREERQQLGGSSGGSSSNGNGSGGGDSGVIDFIPPRWMVQLLLLLRGARFVVANAFPCSPELSDSLTRRCLVSLTSAKALVEQLKGKTRDAKTPFVTFYGSFGSSCSTGKQKAS